MSENRIVFHVDVNSAFLSWSAVKRLSEGKTEDLRTIPAVVGGDEKSRRGVVLAKSVPARAFGINTGESLFEARRKCPNLTVVPSDFPYYTMMSKKLFDLLCSYSPTVEKFSIDEGFLDYTGLESVYGEPVKAAHDLKDRIKHELGFTVNIGVAPNKLLAKMAGELKKPDLVHTLFRHELAGKLWPLPIRELFMVGAGSERVLKSYGIDTIGKLAQCDQELPVRLLKSHGLTLWKYANGIDNTPVTPNAGTKAKSISNAATLAKDAVTDSECHLTLLRLCQSVCMRMRCEMCVCSTVSVQIKYSDFSVFSKQRHIKEPTDDTDYIYRQIKEVFAALWNGKPVRLLGVALSGLSPADGSQMTIFDSMEQEKHRRLDAVCDSIRLKFGNNSIGYGAELESDEISHLDRFFPESGKQK